MRIAYLEPFSGVSGDLFLGALVDAGADPDGMQAAIDGLGIDGLRLQVKETVRDDVRATKVDVAYPAQSEHRHLSTIVAILEAGGLPGDVRDDAVAVFARLAAAEASVHGTTVEEVHFHEVGAADAIADVVGTVAGLHQLGVEKLLVGSVNVGSGQVKCAHGVLPVPAPATAKLLAGWTCHSAGPSRELTTPTGAALVTTLGRQVASAPDLRSTTVGWGAGGSDPIGWPNVLRLVIGESVGEALARTGGLLSAHALADETAGDGLERVPCA